MARGSVVVSGVESLIQSGGRRYVDFSFDRFADYLVRGVWPLLVSIGWSMVIGIPMTILGYLLGIGGVFAGLAGGPFGVLAVVGGILLISIPIGLILQGILNGMLLRVGLSQDLGDALEIGWVMRFASKTWLEMVLAYLFALITVPFLMLAGALACGVGIFFVGILLFMSHAHYNYQYYMMHLVRGGEPISPKFAPPQQGHGGW